MYVCMIYIYIYIYIHIYINYIHALTLDSSLRRSQIGIDTDVLVSVCMHVIPATYIFHRESVLQSMRA